MRNLWKGLVEKIKDDPHHLHETQQSEKLKTKRDLACSMTKFSSPQNTDESLQELFN
jgi:hypothetical protein